MPKPVDAISPACETAKTEARFPKGHMPKPSTQSLLEISWPKCILETTLTRLETCSLEEANQGPEASNVYFRPTTLQLERTPASMSSVPETTCNIALHVTS